MKENKTVLLIEAPYWIGAAADLLWAIALFFPSIYGALTGQEDFSPDLRVRLIMGIGAILMFGWTVLLLWGSRSPIERRFLMLLTPVLVCALGIVSLISYIHFRGVGIWIMIKTIFLMIIMTTSYLLAHQQKKKMSSQDSGR